MARYRRRRYARRPRRSYRSRRRTFKKRSYGRKLVSRRMLRRVLRPLRPEVKMIQLKNDAGLTASGPNTVLSLNDYTFPAPNSSNAPTTAYFTTTALNQPFCLTNLASGVAMSERVGRKIQIKKIDFRVRLNNTQAFNSNLVPVQVRAVLIRSNEVPQNPAAWDVSHLYLGPSYPAIAQHSTNPEVNPPYWHYLETATLDSLPQIQFVGGMSSKGARVVRQTKFKMGPDLGRDTTMKNIHWVIRPKHITIYNDSDKSAANGYFQYGHYWFQLITDQASYLTCPNNALQCRIWYTDV